MKIVDGLGVQYRILDTLHAMTQRAKGLHPLVVVSGPEDFAPGVAFDPADEARHVASMRGARQIQLAFLLGDVAALKALLDVAVDESRRA